LKNSKGDLGGIIHDTIIIFLITLIAGLALGYVNEITKEPIKAAEAAAVQKAYQAIFPSASKFLGSDNDAFAVKSSAKLLTDSGNDFGNCYINDAVAAKSSDGSILGYVVTATTKDGFGGDIEISLGVDTSGKTTGLEILSISETAGLGMKAQNEDWRAQFVGKTVDSFTVTKAGAKDDTEVDAITSATITSRAVTHAVNAALYFAKNSGQEGMQ